MAVLKPASVSYSLCAFCCLNACCSVCPQRDWTCSLLLDSLSSLLETHADNFAVVALAGNVLFDLGHGQQVVALHNAGQLSHHRNVLSWICNRKGREKERKVRLNM